MSELEPTRGELVQLIAELNAEYADCRAFCYTCRTRNDMLAEGTAKHKATCLLAKLLNLPKEPDPQPLSPQAHSHIQRQLQSACGDTEAAEEAR